MTVETEAHMANGHNARAPQQLHPATERPSNGHTMSNMHNGAQGATLLEDGAHDLVEPIAIIGMAVKFPQEADSQEGFWQMLVNGRSAATEIPANRMNIDAYYHPDKEHAGTMSIRGGHFIKEDIECFDAPFFSMSPAEASSLDPQQRCLLEVTYQALENAGIPLEKASGSNTSVYVGSFLHEHELFITRDPEYHMRHKNTAVLQSLLANRISWYFDFKGPSLTLDTACSSSLHAMHLAVQSLRARECTMSVVSGSNIFYDPQSMVAMHDHGFLSPDYRCYTFDHRANGYSRGEGVSTIILKPLSLALRDGDTVRAVIRSSGLNQDGRTNGGITQPNPEAQTELIKQVYQTAGLSMAKTRFFEAHGTGTQLGDKLETQAFSEAFKDVRDSTPPLIVGAVKTNVGHLEAASALAGVVKSVLTLERGIIPPNTNFEKLNPEIKADEWNLQFPLEAMPWPEAGVRRASINSFGLGGANAHAILEDAYHYLEERKLRGKHATHVGDHTVHLDVYNAEALNGETNGHPVVHVNGNGNGNGCLHTEISKPKFLFVWSAADKGGIKRVVDSYRAHLDTISDKSDKTYLQNLAWTLSKKRSHLSWRSMTIASSLAELKERMLEAPKTTVKSQTRPVAFVFTGQGAQWFAMGRELFAYDRFRESIKESDASLARLGCEWSLEAELLKDQSLSRVNEPAFSQPICVALQIALVDLLRTWKMLPSVVVGHSSGEISAAYCAGAISLGSAMRIAYYRGVVVSGLRKQQTLPCGMMAAGLSADSAQQHLDKLNGGAEDGEVSVACINSPSNVTISGSAKKIEALKSILEGQGVFARQLKVDVAYHSGYMDAGSATYRKLLGTLEIGNSSSQLCPMVSSVTGKPISETELRSPDYWVRNLTNKVNFSAAVSHMKSTAFAKAQDWTLPDSGRLDCFLEVGPHAALQSPLREICKAVDAGKPIQYQSLLYRGRSAEETMLEVTGTLHCLGVSIDTSLVNERSMLSDHDLLTQLPPYPFNHTKLYWEESRLEKETRFRTFPRHDLLGSPVPDWNPYDAKWRNYLRPGENPWTMGHAVNGLDVCPAAGMLVMAMEAAYQVSANRSQITTYQFREVTFSKALSVSRDVQDPVIEIEFHLRRTTNAQGKAPTWSNFSLYMMDNDQWSLCCQGSISLMYDDSEATEKTMDQSTARMGIQYSPSQLLEACQQRLDKKELYRYLDGIELQYGPTFQALEEIRHNDAGAITASADLRHWKGKVESQLVSHVIHPAALDTVFQLIIPALTRGCKDQIATVVPVKVESLTVSESLRSITDGQVQLFTKAVYEGFRNAKASAVAVSRETGHPCVSATWHATSVASGEANPKENDQYQRLCYHVDTKPDPDLLEGPEIEQWCQTDEDIYYPNEVSHLKKTELCHLALSRLLDSPSMEDLSAKRPELQRYAAWAKDVLARTESESAYDWRVHQGDETYFQSTLEQMRVLDTEGALLTRVAENLERIFQGEVIASELLFSDDVVENMYQKGLGVPHVFRQTARYIDALAAKNPALRILEIGAGTGSGTEQIINALEAHPGKTSKLSRFKEYRYTDISGYFLERGRKKFPEYTESGQMTFSLLDIEKDPLEQNLEAEHYDLIVALNVIHATSSLETTLSHARKLLKPGGHLLLIELTGTRLMPLEFVFGLFAGWWLSTEPERKDKPLIPEESWDAYLKNSGFSGVDAALRNHEKEQYHAYSAMIATVPIPDETNVPIEEVSIVLDSDSPEQLELAVRLRQKLTSTKVGFRSLTELENGNIVPTNYVFLVEITTPFFYDISDSYYSLIQKVFSTAKSILWIYSGEDNQPLTSLVSGIQRTYRAEIEALPFTMLSLMSGKASSATARNIVNILEVMRGDIPATAESEYVEKNGVLCIQRVVQTSNFNKQIMRDQDTSQTELKPFGQSPKRALKLEFEHIGLLNTLQFSDDEQVLEPLKEDEIEIEVMHSGVNFRDVVTALGQVDDTVLGLEGSGVVTKAGSESGFSLGDKVCALLLGSFRTFARCKAALARRLPEGLDMASAAGLPIVFCTAYHALVNLARLAAGESILIHSGAGGLGQAAIQIAQMIGATVFTTVGTEEKRQILIDRYHIETSHIFSSRSLAFAGQIKELTNGQGVDVVLNSLSGEYMRASWECIAPFGRFIETGRKDADSFGTLPMASFACDTMFAGINLVNIMRNRPHIAGQLLESVLKLAAEGKLSPSHPVVSYSISELEGALRLMQSGKNVGKMIVNFDAAAKVPMLPSTQSSYYFKSDASYLIAGGLGGLGKTVSHWMVSRGARYLILLSWSRKEDEGTQAFLKEMKDAGVTIATPVCDICDEQSLKSALQDCSTMPPVKGCIQAAMVLKDGKFDSMPKADFDAVLRPKTIGSWNLHKLLPRGLDFFILFSSLAGIAPSYGQANYAAGNSYQDALARYRVSQGEKAVSFDIGMVVDAGFVAQHTGLAEQLSARGAAPVYTSDILQLLEYHCDPTLPLPSLNESQAILGLQTPAALRAQGIEEPWWLQRPLFRYLTHTTSALNLAAGTTVSASASSLESQLGAASSLAQAAEIVCEAMALKLAKILVMERADVQIDRPVVMHGVDSLVAMELRQWLRKFVRADLAAFEILGNATLTQVAFTATQRSELVSTKVKEESVEVEES